MPGLFGRAFRLSTDLGIYLGTSNTLVYARGTGIVMAEPSVVAVERGTNRVLEIGQAARDMLGRTPGNITAIQPLRDGVIADYTVTTRMLRHIISRVCGSGWARIIRPRVVLSVPSAVTNVERRAVIEAATEAGAKRAIPIEEPMAAAIGAGLPIDGPHGNMVIDIGGGTTDMAVISLGSPVVSDSVRIAGNRMDQAIIRHVRRTYSLQIGEQTAEHVKIQIGSAARLEPELELDVRGRDSVTGLPRTVAVHSHEIREALAEPVFAIIERSKHLLEQTPPELAADIMERGIHMSGGGALLRGFDKLLSAETGIPVFVAEEPLHCVALGTGAVLEHIDKLSATGLSEPPPLSPPGYGRRFR